MSDDSASMSEEDVNVSDKADITAPVDCNERARLTEQIKMMQKEIFRLRKKLTVRYSKLHVSFKDIKKEKYDESNGDMGPSSYKRVRFLPSLELMFYGIFTKIHLNKDNTHMTIFLTVPGKETYGLQFIQRENLYNLVRCCLPYSLKVHEEKLKANSLTQMQLTDYVRHVRKNIYAYHKRLEQVEQFKMRVNKKEMYFNHDLACTDLEMLFRVTVEEGDWIDFRIRATFRYDLLDIRPRKIIAIGEDNDLRKQEQIRVQKYLLQYQHKSLPELYDEVFAGQPPYKFL